MDITTSITLSSDEKNQLSEIFNCSPANIETTLKTISSAAMEEYTNMILGKKSLQRGTDIREYRLFLLIKRFFTERLPNEEMVTRIFQTTSTQSRTLLRSVASKYQYELKSIINKTISGLLEEIEVNVLKTGTLLIINTHSRFFIELMNEKIASINVILPSVQLRGDCTSSYSIKPSAYLALCKAYGLQPKPI